MKSVKTVSPAALCNEITMNGLQWLFILGCSLTSSGKERGFQKGRRQLVLNHHKREVGCRLGLWRCGSGRMIEKKELE